MRPAFRYVELRGDTADRAAPVRRFEAGEVPLFLISLKAGGRGLNLTSADTVIHYDPWWNPAVEEQASDRAHRIGQTKSVFVYKLIAADTVEERILELQERKAALASIAFSEEGPALPNDGRRGHRVPVRCGPQPIGSLKSAMLNRPAQDGNSRRSSRAVWLVREMIGRWRPARLKR